VLNTEQYLLSMTHFYKKYEYVIFQYIINILGMLGVAYAVITLNFYLLVMSYLLHVVYKLFAYNIALHRYFSHKSFKTTPAKHKFLCWVSTIIGAGPPFLFSSAHRHHHVYSDTDKDLHGPTKGIIKTIYWDMIPSNTSQVKKFAIDVYRDHTASKVQRYYYIVWYSAIITGLLFFPMALFFGLLVPHVMFRWHAGIFVNTLTHRNSKLNYRNFDTTDNSSNNSFIGMITLGEGYHNNHHNNPSNYKFSQKSTEYDLTSWTIKKLFI
jgi:stearoyl-CoA desaturase (delta-9 desaturase)